MQRILHLSSICPSVLRMVFFQHGSDKRKKTPPPERCRKKYARDASPDPTPDPRVRTCCLNVMESGRAKSVSPFCLLYQQLVCATVWGHRPLFLLHLCLLRLATVSVNSQPDNAPREYILEIFGTSTFEVLLYNTFQQHL